MYKILVLPAFVVILAIFIVMMIQGKKSPETMKKYVIRGLIVIGGLTGIAIALRLLMVTAIGTTIAVSANTIMNEAMTNIGVLLIAVFFLFALGVFAIVTLIAKSIVPHASKMLDEVVGKEG